LRDRINEGLDAVGLTDRRHDRVKNFSGGMKRRLNLIAALLHRPKLLLCDEPTVVYPSHYMEEATRLCSRIAVIDHGKILADGTLNELLSLLPSSEQINLPKSPTVSAALPHLREFGVCVSNDNGHQIALPPGTALSAVFKVLEDHAVPPGACSLSRPDLEDLFLHLTGTAFRE
tara:strand:- start:1621 stop:2142 length:522 start_codon:yes stop_codon:yes gene_type:complete